MEQSLYPGSDHGRILALDVGKRRIGLAVSDELGLTAQGLPTLERGRSREDIEQLAALASEKEISLFVLGKPLHMSGAEGAQAEFVKEFGERLGRRTGVPVDYWDERLTTVEATRVLRSAGRERETRKGAADRLAAVLLLESYLEWRRRSGEGREGE